MELRDSGDLKRRQKLKQDLDELRRRGLIMTADKAMERPMRMSRQEIIEMFLRGDYSGKVFMGGTQRRVIQ